MAVLPGVSNLGLTPTVPFLVVGEVDFGVRVPGLFERTPDPAPAAPPVAAVPEIEDDTTASDPIRAAANAAMERYARGDDQAFGDLYDGIVPRLHHYLLGQVRDPARAEDLLQQTMLHIHRARGRFLPGAEVLPWAFAIARRLLIDSIRRRKHEQQLAGGRDDADGPRGAEPVAPGRSADELLDTKRLAEALSRELARLPESHRVAFELIKQEGLSVREAAQVLGTTATAVKLRAHRAYVALRAALGDIVDNA